MEKEIIKSTKPEALATFVEHFLALPKHAYLQASSDSCILGLLLF